MRSLLKQVLMVLVLWLLAVSAFSRAPLTGYAITEPFSVIPNRITIQKPTDKGEKLRNSSIRKKAAQLLSANQVSFAAVAKPDIKYTTPNIYIRNTAIPALAPTNTGGAVPATIYGETKVFAGTGQFGAANGDVTTAQFKLPYGISVDDDGNIYISEAGGGGIRMISAAGQVSSLGTDGLPGPPFNAPKFNNPHGVVKDKNGNLFVANFNNHNILKVTPSGTVSVFAGVLFAGTADGPGNVANIISPNGIAIDKDDNLYVSDGNNAIRKISPAGYVYTLAGQRLAGAADGQGRAAKFNHPGGLVLDKDGNIYVADQSNFSIRKITPNGFVTTVAGGTFGYADGVGAAAQFQHPTGITIDQSGNLYVMDTNNGTVRRITPDGEVKTIAGGGPVGVESGVGTDVHFSESYGIAMGPDGNLYVAEYGKNSIKQVVATGYTIDKPLPAGLTFNPRTGIITGTPTVLWPRTDYTVTAYNAGGSSKFILTIEVNDTAQPVIAVSNVTGSSTACAGSASADYQQLNISASNLTGSVTVIPTSNFEVSLTNSNYGVSLGMAAAYVESQIVTIYVRLSPTASAGSQTGDVIVRSAGVADLHVPVNGMVKQVVTPTVTVSQKDLSICSNQPITFVATSTDEGINPVYQWYVNNLPQGGNTKEFTVPASTLKTDKITVSLTNTSDCANQPLVQSEPVSPVTVSNSPDLEVVSVAGLPVCEGTDQTFKANSSNPGINPGYAWQINGAFVGGGSDTFTTNVLKTGDILSCTLTIAEACNVPVTANLTIQTEAPPTVTFNGEVSIKKGESIALSPVLSGNIVTYSWSPSAGLSNDAIKNPTASPGSTTVYTLKVKSAGGCENSAIIKVNVTAPVVVTAKPDITYTTPNIYIRNITIPALSPTNTGGAVPATIYSETKVIAGTGQLGSVNGDAATAQFKLPYGISVDADGNIYIAESGAGIRMINTSGQVSSIGTDALPGPPFNVPKLNGPRGVVKDKAGNLFVANYNNHNILKITPAGVVTVFAGINQSGTADGPGNVANIIYPNGIAIDKDDNLYVTDGNNAIRKISPSGYVYTLAGQPAAGTLDGQGRAAKFNKPGGIAVDNDGNVYVADLAGFVIRKITPNGYVSTIAGNGTYGSRDGIGTAAGFQSPKGITVDASGNVYVTENGVGVIRRISPDGEVKTIAGGGPNGVNSGVGTDVNFGTPEGIAIGPDGNLYVAEYGKNTIKQVIATGYTIDKALPAGLIFDPRTGIITGTPTVLWPRTDYTVTAYNAGGSDKFVLSIEVNDVAPPEIGVGDVSGVITACFGSVSTNYQQFAVSEVNLADDVLVTAPANFEVSLSPNGGYSISLIIPLADLQLPPDGDGITVYVRSAASAPVGNPTGNVTLKSTGATDVQVPVSGVIKPIVTPAVTISSPSVYPVCEGTEQTFTAVPSNAGSNPNYQWQINGNNVGSNNNRFKSNTLKNGDVLICIVSNASQCVSPGISDGFNIQTNVLPTVAFNGDVFIKKGESIVLVPIVSSGITTYNWSPSAGLSNSGIQNPVASPTVTTTYTLTVTATGGCPASAIIKVNVADQMVIPNTFTPNGDGVNDTWSIPALAAYPNCRVNVYNRYGAGIFSSIGYAKNWNGCFNGYVLPAGTYYYTVDLKDGKKPLSGYVTLLK